MTPCPRHFALRAERRMLSTMKVPNSEGRNKSLREGRMTQLRGWLRDQSASFCCCCRRSPRRSLSGYLEEVSSLNSETLSEGKWPQAKMFCEQPRSRSSLLSLDTTSASSLDGRGGTPAQSAESGLPQGCVELLVGVIPLYSDIVLHAPPRNLGVLGTQPAGPGDNEKVPSAPYCQQAQEPESSASVEPSATLETGPSAKTAGTPEPQPTQAPLAPSWVLRATLSESAVEKALGPAPTPDLALPSLGDTCIAFLIYCMFMSPFLYGFISLFLT
ncbi:uncharacterized protein LOC132539940 [Erinaceus europaeus]|uniref:Uncharacterized protein LOC132539940 n=1 Tax=Erinaceus europaeus TaxID=9365 RepID=A0ABM3XV13_ERIEU|nr:uncharacterized protein LOC132539940 [Erinaceus europaeus]